MTADPLKEAALRYALAGQPVFPCGILRKSPNGKLAHHGVKDATTRIPAIEDWWSRAPRSNIGWPTQVRGSDPFAVDVDTKHGIDGWASVEQLNSEHPEDPIPFDGPGTVTPSKPPEGSGLKRGGHIWLRAKDELAVPSKVSIAPGIDTRGEGGYVLVAPSRTEDGEYQGNPPLDPSSVPYAPVWLLDMIRGGKPSPARDDPRVSSDRTAPANAEETAEKAVPIAGEYWKPGSRRLLTHALAVFFGRDLGLSQDRTEALVRAIADSAGDREPIARDKIADAWKRIGKGKRASVRYWLDQAGVPELGERLFDLLRGPAPGRAGGAEAPGPGKLDADAPPMHPWAGKAGWENEPTLVEKTETRKVGVGESAREIRAPVEPGYLVYNREVAELGFRPFRTLSGEPRVAVPTAHGVEVHDPRSPAFVDWTGFRYYAMAGDRIPGRELGIAAKVLAGRASAPELPRTRIVDLSIRVAPVGRYVTLLDLGDPDRRCIRLGADGWSVERTGMPVFERPSHMLPLPEPERASGANGDWTRCNGLFRFVSIGLADPAELKTDEERDARALRLEGQRLLVRAEVVHFLLAPRSPKVIPIINGDDGSGKSHLAAKLGAVTDPSIVQHVPIPETEQDLLALALNRATISLDNVSRIDLWLSDALARLCTGTGLAKRRLYTDRDEVVSRLIPRIILNGITAVPKNPDLIRRALFLWAVRPDPSLGDEEYDVAWEKAHPSILGGFLDLACLTARVLRDSPPGGNGESMADFVRIGRAVAIAMGKNAKEFDLAWTENQSRQIAAAEENPWVGALRGVFAELRGGGSISPEAIAKKVGELHRDSFPRGVTSQEVGNAISRVRTTLRTLGLPIERRRGTAGVHLYYVGNPESGVIGVTQKTLPSAEDSDTRSDTPVTPPLSGVAPVVTPDSEVSFGRHQPEGGVSPSMMRPEEAPVTPVTPPLEVSEPPKSGPVTEEAENWTAAPKDRARPKGGEP